MLTRRHFCGHALRLSVAAGLASACSGPAHRVLQPRWAPVDARPERVIRVVTGLRPFRAGGFVVRREYLGGKTLVHHYGHGGGGVTLSWGTARLALERVSDVRRGPCAVIGCGAIGLATARLLQGRGFDVTIYARELPPATVSNVAGAWWSPYAVHDRAIASLSFVAELERAARLAFAHFRNLVGPRHGVHWRQSLTLSRDQWSADPAPDSLDTFMPRTLLASDQRPFDAPYVYQQYSMLIEPHTYLRELMAEIRGAGGRIVARHFATPEDLLALDEPLIFNCTGLGSRELFGDTELTPIKGQLVVLAPQPEIDYVLFAPGRLYMFPRADGIVLGGTFEPGVESAEPDPQQTDRILAGHRALAASIRA